MQDFLTEYFELRYQQQESISEVPLKPPGPVLTISRECGCDGTYIAQKLAAHLNDYFLPIGAKTNWHVISKEVLQKSAKKLQTSSESIKFVFDSEPKSMLEDFVESMSAQEYHSEAKIKNAIKKVIRDFARDGHAVILGRAGAQLTRDIDKSLHVKLIAPLNWRVKSVMLKLEISRAAAINFIRKVDLNREKIIKKFYVGDKSGMCYDVIYNHERITSDQLISDIIHTMQLKKLI
jgi:cytidylate kinase